MRWVRTALASFVALAVAVVGLHSPVASASVGTASFPMGCSNNASMSYSPVGAVAAGSLSPDPAAALAPVTLSGTTLELDGFAGSLPLAGYNLGFLPASGSLATTATVTIAGSSTVEGTQSRTVSAATLYSITDPDSIPMSGDETWSSTLELALPDTTWTGTGGTIEVAITTVTYTMVVIPGMASVSGDCQPGTVSYVPPSGNVLVPAAPTTFATAAVEGSGAQGLVAPGGTVATSPDVTLDLPLGASVTTPTGGQITIVQHDGPPAPPAPAGYALVGDPYVTITAPPATVTDPLILRFVVDSSLVGGSSPPQLTLLRDGVAVADCTVAGEVGSAAPDPCVGARALLGDGDVAITVRSSHASDWLVVRRLNDPPIVDAGGPYEVNEGSQVTLAAAASDPDGDALGYAWAAPTATVGTLSSATAVQPSYRGIDDGVDVLALTVTDGAGATASDTAAVTVANVAPAITSMGTSAIAPVPLGTSVSVAATWADPGLADTFVAAFGWGDGTSTSAAVAAGGASATRAHAYTSPGVYEVSMEVRDDDDGVDREVHQQYVVVFDPAGGFVTGGGWFSSPAGAYTGAPTAAGKATFGFVSKYKKGATVPTGNTEFQLHTAGFDLSSTSYDWLVVAGSRAKFKGTATVNGIPGFGFMLTAVDGAPDSIRMKVWSLADGHVVYDNRMGSDDAGYDATALGGGSIIVHR